MSPNDHFDKTSDHIKPMNASSFSVASTPQAHQHSMNNITPISTKSVETKKVVQTKEAPIVEIKLLISKRNLNKTHKI